MQTSLEQLFSQVKTPCYICMEEDLRRNGEILKEVAERSGAKILLAQKAFSMYHTYPMLREYLAGTAASGLYEAKLGKTCFGKETHVFCGAYREEEFDEICELSDHVVMNSCNQLLKFAATAKKHGCELGLRINPECSTQEGHEIYDPCGFGSRLGVTIGELQKHPECVALLDGIHFHTLCEQNADALLVTLQAVEDKFGEYLSQMKWVNFGGGHHITREDYDREALIAAVQDFSKKYGVQVYLEPGEAIALNAGYLVATVLDLVENGVEIAMLDTSAACHMPDVLEMPYQPRITGALAVDKIGALVEQYPYRYRLGGPTCLAGDVIGEYGFSKKLEIGDRLIFHDMAIYSMVKNNTFNGMPLPDIDFCRLDGTIEVVKRFGYEDFKGRLS